MKKKEIEEMRKLLSKENLKIADEALAALAAVKRTHAHAHMRTCDEYTSDMRPRPSPVLRYATQGYGEQAGAGIKRVIAVITGKKW